MKPYLRKAFGRICLMIFGSALALVAHAQQPYELTAEEAVALALKQVNEIKNLQVDRRLQVAQNREITGQALPQVTGSIALTHYFNIPVTFLPDFISPAVFDVLVDQGVRDANGDPIVKPGGDPQLFPAQFGVPWQASAGFSIQQLLFQPDVFVGLQARGASLEYADLNVKVMEDSIRSNVYRSYYSVLIAEKRKRILDESVARLVKLLNDQTEMFKNGFAERLDLDKTQVALNNLRTSLMQVENLVALGYAGLKFATGLKQQDSLALKDTLSMERLKEDLLDQSGFTYEQRSEIQLLNTVSKLQGLDVKRNKLAKIPTVSAYWNFSENAQRQKFNFFNRDERWFRTSFVGLNVSIPIFSGFQQNRRIERAELTLEKTRNNIDNLKRAIDFQQVAAGTQLRNALAALDVQDRNLELAERVFNTTKIKFEQGLGSSFEILQSQQGLDESQANYFQALYDAVIARIGYLRSFGRL